ncbi:anti-sigma factor [Oceaniglobus trochenteri]|uniref:anti-sigma factor n=1 Tax=Oceaniglobus trochenteri TaxID=2763260 RepID=UPI001CFFD239|nr:anti-sigma factor [Oceaniglobus trochenteri]
MTDMEPDNDEMMVAEYALHLLSPQDRQAVDQRLAVDGALRARLAWWSDRLAPLADEIAEVDPPKALRAALARAIQAETAQQAPAPTRRGGWSMFKLFGGAGLALALGLAVMTQLPEVDAPAAFEPTYVAGIAGEENALVINVAYSDESGEMHVERRAGAAPEGRVLELWVIAEGSPGPVSLGVLPDDPEAVMIVPEDLRESMPGATLAVSEEPPGGSPIAGPSGAVLGAGALVDA